MLDFEQLRAFMLDMKDYGRISIQDSMGNIVLITQDCPKIDGLIEHGIWFRIGNGEWMARHEFENIIFDWRDREPKEIRNR